MQRIAASKWPSRQAAKAGACIGRSAVQTERHLEAAFDGKIGAERLAAQAHVHDFAPGEMRGLPRWDRQAVAPADLKAAAADQRYAGRRACDFELGPGTDDFQAGGALGVSDQCVGKQVAIAVERARHGNADMLEAAPSLVLEGGMETWRD